MQYEHLTVLLWSLEWHNNVYAQDSGNPLGESLGNFCIK